MHVPNSTTLAAIAVLGRGQQCALSSYHRCAVTWCAVLCYGVQGGHEPWLLHVVRHVADHSGMYIIMQAVEEMLGPHHIARLERLTYAALTRYAHLCLRSHKFPEACRSEGKLRG
jgi:hypothetical protein